MAGTREARPDAPLIPQQIGPDGWPIGRDEAADDEGWRRQHECWLQTRLRICERAVVEDRYGPALMDALKLCIDHKRPVPPWLAKSIWAILAYLLNKPRNRKRGEAMTSRRAKHYDGGMRSIRFVTSQVVRRGIMSTKTRRNIPGKAKAETLLPKATNKCSGTSTQGKRTNIMWLTLTGGESKPG